MPARTIQIAGETLVARADRTLHWPAEKTLFVADVHFGKAATFRSAAVPVPVGTTSAGIERLSRAVEETFAKRVIFLGDLWHAREGRRAEILESVRSWRQCCPSVEMVLVEGNHDRRSGVLPEALGIETVLEPYGLGAFALCHYPQRVAGAYCLSGHIHPAVSLTGTARQSIRLPCFWFGCEVGVLPAFGEFTGSADVEPAPGDMVLVIAEGRIHEAQFKLSKTSRSGQPTV